MISTTVGIAILFNNIVAMWWLGEKIVYKYDVPAFILIVAGSTAIVILSVEGEESYTPEVIKELLEQPGTIVLTIFTVVLFGVALFSLKLLNLAAENF